MPILHKFYQANFANGFETHNAILDVTPYKPEVMFIGTFNPSIPGNNADFFYGRNYFWSGFKNLFVNNTPLILTRRDAAIPFNPTLLEIFELCQRLKLTFADLIQGVLNKDNPTYNLLSGNRVNFGGDSISLIEDNGLMLLDGMGQVSWNTQNIIKYLCEHPEIKTIYFTRRPTGIWAAHWSLIVNNPCMKGRNLTNIYTPSGLALRGVPRMVALLHHWVHNMNPNFGRLDNTWLINNGVNLGNF